ncbi:MAG: hypothetical protein WC165_09435 [Dysgonamonadaceae bacterium]
MKKLTRKSLSELAIMMPILNEIQQKKIVGGGDGSIYHPYTVAEFDAMCANGTWNGGYVEDWGYTYAEVTVSGSYGGSGSYDSSGSYVSPSGNMYSINNAVDFLTNNANDSSTGYCARSVRQAIEAGGISTEGRPNSACDYDTWLPTIGFSAVDSSNYTPQVGDIVVFEAIDGHPYGHIAMYNGQQWISDFVQIDMYGGSAYRNDSNSTYTILRQN